MDVVTPLFETYAKNLSDPTKYAKLYTSLMDLGDYPAAIVPNVDGTCEVVLKTEVIPWPEVNTWRETVTEALMYKHTVAITMESYMLKWVIKQVTARNFSYTDRDRLFGLVLGLETIKLAMVVCDKEQEEKHKLEKKKHKLEEKKQMRKWAQEAKAKCHCDCDRAGKEPLFQSCRECRRVMCAYCYLGLTDELIFMDAQGLCPYCASHCNNYCQLDQC